MEVYLSRGALRRAMRARLQMATDDVLASQNTEQFNGFLDSAVMKALQDTRWQEALRQTTYPVGLAQYKIPYPTGTAVGSILSASIYDIESNQYATLTEEIIRTSDSVDQAELAGGSTFTAIQGKPMRYEQRGDFIYLDPPPMKPMNIRLEYEVALLFVDDTTVALVDSFLILYWALGMATVHEPESKALWTGMYADRLGMLRGWQATGQVFAMDSTASFNEDEEIRSGLSSLPNYNAAPTVR